MILIFALGLSAAVGQFSATGEKITLAEGPLSGSPNVAANGRYGALCRHYEAGTGWRLLPTHQWARVLLLVEHFS